MISTAELLEFTKSISIRAGEILNNNFGKIQYIKDKPSAIDLCTNADIESEKFITESILKEFPNHSIIAEEGYWKQTNSDYRRIIDPLDGTTNYTHNLPIFSVSIGLQYKEETILGVVYNPAVDKLFHAIKNEGAFMNDNKISVSSSNTLSDSLIVTGFPYLQDEKWNNSFTIFKEFYSKTQGVRRLGAAALDLCFVAMGRFEVFYEFNLKPWDICAGSIIAEEAGALITDWDGSKCPDSGERIIASNGYVHKEALNILKKNSSSF